MRADQPPVCCASQEPHIIGTSFAVEQLAMLLRAPREHDRPRLSVPPVVEVCVVP